MKLRCILLTAALLGLAVLLQSCTTQLKNSGSFIPSLEGQLVFSDLSSSDGWSMVDFSDATAKIKQLASFTSDTLSPDGIWRLSSVQEEDTNGDGVVDFQDLSSLYLEHTKDMGRRKIPLLSPVGACGWGPNMTAVCSFASNDVGNSDVSLEDTSVIYQIDLFSGELLKLLSDPTESSSWVPIVSPNREWVAFETAFKTEEGLKPGGIRVIDIQTGRLIYAITESSAREPVWSPDSMRIAFVASLAYGEYSETTIKGMYNDVFYVDLNDEAHMAVNVTRTSRFSKIPAPLTDEGGIMVGNPVWSPDGKTIASVWRQYSKQEIWTTSVDGDGWAKLVGGPDHQYYLIEWKP